jgi:hypothetical protein
VQWSHQIVFSDELAKDVPDKSCNRLGSWVRILVGAFICKNLVSETRGSCLQRRRGNGASQMKVLLLCALMFVFGFIVSDIAPRNTVNVRPVANSKTGIRGVMIITDSNYDPFFIRESVAMISDEDWERFCPLNHKEIKKIK